VRVVLSQTLSESISRLTAPEQSAAKQSVYDFQINPANPGLQFHRIDASKDRHFWSSRVNRDLRMVVHRTGDTSVLCYVGHHDDAYRWAEKRKIEVHPETGAAQFVVLDERVEEIVRRVVREEVTERPAFASLEPRQLAALGVPEEHVAAVKAVRRDQMDRLIGVLPDEAMERLLDYADGKALPNVLSMEVGPDPYRHPDAQRRFRVIDSADELRDALEGGWAKWTVFLHPDQRTVIERRWGGSARVTGAAGTGKTVVALHRAVHLLHGDTSARVLLTTFSTTLAARLEQHSQLLLMNAKPQARRLTVQNLHRIARELWSDAHGRSPKIVDERSLNAVVAEVASRQTIPFVTPPFLKSEWSGVYDANGIATRDAYLAVSRAGRGTPLSSGQREVLWPQLAAITARLDELGLLTWNRVFLEAADALASFPGRRFDHVIADEVQDFGVAELRFVRALTPRGPADLFLCGDSGQTIYRGRSALAQAGIDVRGRSTRLKVNYRTTQQIQHYAERVLEGAAADEHDADRDSISLLSGPPPILRGNPSVEAEVKTLRDWIASQRADGLAPRDIALFGRTHAVLSRAKAAIEAAGLQWRELDDEQPVDEASIAVGTMHRAKGLEFRAVAVGGCDSDQMPLDAALREAGDELERRAAEQRERRLFYVACTRAREHLLITWTGEGSAFTRSFIAKEAGSGA
jgi:superfamily I DNA/RNA helicase